MEARTSAVMAVVTDLFFKSKINEAAKQSGLEVAYARDRAGALGLARQSRPPLIIVDLNAADGDPLGLIRDLKADAELRAVPLVAFVAHVDAGLQAEARAAGCDRVMARSIFFKNLTALLEQTAQ
jgi:CheY-like chemotaxis protein